MTIFDLLFIVLFLTAIGTLIAAIVSAFSGRRARALAILRMLVLCAASYIGIVYLATAFSRQTVLHVGDPQCSDDWCLAVDGVKRTPKNAVMLYDISLRIFSRARRVAQRENVAKDVYLLDAQHKRYDPVLTGAEIPLNTLLQPGESVTTTRTFQLPANASDIGLMVDRSSILPVCVIIGECGAFHMGAIVRID
ncbi:exported hypothetical protein [Candidatus Sulfopaludibacter sp. SbA3]|nr:exported hypothetical protein [Candidatus Sulfopaludibacter sp. SbA3]